MDDTPRGPGPNDWQRWRGSIDAKIDDHHSRLREFDMTNAGIREAFDRLETKIGEMGERLHTRITRVEIRVAWYMGAVFVVGSVLGMIATQLLGRALG